MMNLTENTYSKEKQKKNKRKNQSPSEENDLDHSLRKKNKRTLKTVIRSCIKKNNTNLRRKFSKQNLAETEQIIRLQTQY